MVIYTEVGLSILHSWTMRKYVSVCRLSVLLNALNSCVRKKNIASRLQQVVLH